MRFLLEGHGTGPDKQISQAVSVHICPENVKALVGEGHNSQKVDGINLIMAL